jgi:hypothetical protein
LKVRPHSGALAAFIVVGLLGPLIRLLTWPPAGTGSAQEDFIYDIVLLLWPAQPVALGAAGTAGWVSVIMAASLNVLAFGCVGVTAIALGARRLALLLTYAFTCGLIYSWAVLWGLKTNGSYLSRLAIVIALAAYAVPFCITNQECRRTGRQE